MGFNAIAPSDVPEIDGHFPEAREEDASDEGDTPRNFIDSHSPKINVRNQPLKKAQYYDPPPQDRDANEHEDGAELPGSDSYILHASKSQNNKWSISYATNFPIYRNTQ